MSDTIGVFMDDLFHDRRPADRQPLPVEQAPEVEVEPMRMGEDEIVDSLRSPAAGEDGGMTGVISMRHRDRDLCRHCYRAILEHWDNSGHLPERMPERTPGVHSDVTDYRARNHNDRRR